MLGMVQDPPFTDHLNLSFYKSGQVNLGNSFLALLSGPPSLLQCDFKEFPNLKLTSDSNSVVVNTIGSGIPLTYTGLPSEYPSEHNLQLGTDFCPSISTRAIEGSDCSSNSVLRGFRCQGPETTAIPCMVPVSEKAKGSFSMSRECYGAVATNAEKVSCTKVQTSQVKSIEASPSFSNQSSSFLSDCPRVFCLGTG